MKFTLKFEAVNADAAHALALAAEEECPFGTSLGEYLNRIGKADVKRFVRSRFALSGQDREAWPEADHWGAEGRNLARARVAELFPRGI